MGCDLPFPFPASVSPRVGPAQAPAAAGARAPSCPVFGSYSGVPRVGSVPMRWVPSGPRGVELEGGGPLRDGRPGWDVCMAPSERRGALRRRAEGAGGPIGAVVRVASSTQIKVAQQLLAVLPTHSC